jgi:hypothetical protein
MASARKRPRPEAEDNRAECPFTIRVVDPREKDQKKKKRRRTDQINEDDPAQKVNIQHSPFSPQGKFKTYDTMDLHYQVEPAKEWTEMTRYNSFVRESSLSQLLRASRAPARGCAQKHTRLANSLTQ